MKEVKQKISEQSETYPKENRTESKGNEGGQTYIRMTENDATNNRQADYGMMEFIVSPLNLNGAYKRVRSNKGAGGVDKMEVESLKDYLVRHKDELMTSIEKGKYRPNPVRRVEIPKDNGSKRQLGIPTVVDRVIQQSITQVLVPVYEPQFSDHSYGFRPRRNAHQALRKSQKYINEGYEWAVEMDLEKFFDTVSHSKLMEVLSRTIKDGRVVSLIHKYLRAGIVLGGKLTPSEKGVPQGGPLSPILSNIMLNELDKELEHRGHKFVRYADDIVILCKSRRSAERTLESIIPFVERKLFLKVNRQKSQVSNIRGIKFLGYSFYIKDGKCKFRLHPRSLQKMKDRIKELTSRSNGWGNDRRKEALGRFITGWVQYFKLADMDKLLVKTDEWYRRRLRMVIWKQWKRIKTRMANLIKLGVKKSKAYEWANTRKSYWHIANSFILNTTITNDRLCKAGFVFLSSSYRKVRVVS